MCNHFRLAKSNPHASELPRTAESRRKTRSVFLEEYFTGGEGRERGLGSQVTLGGTLNSLLDSVSHGLFCRVLFAFVLFWLYFSTPAFTANSPRE